MTLKEDTRIIWAYLKNYKKEVYKLSFLAVFYGLASGVIPYLYGRLVDEAPGESFSYKVIVLLGIWALTSILSEGFRRIVAVRGGFIGSYAAGDLVSEHARHLMNLPLGFHKEKRVGEVVSSITRAQDHLRDIIENTLFWVLPQFLTVAVGLAFMFAISWQLFLGIVGKFLLSIIVTLIGIPKLVDSQKKMNKEYDKAMGTLNDSFLNIQTIKSFTAEDFQNKKIEKSYKDKIVFFSKKVLTVWENITFIQEIIFSLGFVAIFSYALMLLEGGEISIGVLVMFLGYLNLTRMPLRVFLWQWLTVQKGLATIKNSRKYLKLKTENSKVKKRVIKDIKGKVEYKNVSFRYPKKPVLLQDVTFAALPGEKVAIVGASGQGKTTLVDLLSLYYSPTRGQILIDGVNIKNLNLAFLRSIIAYVPQDVVLFNDTIKNNILYGKPAGKIEDVERAAEIANIDNFVNSLPQKYNTMVGERGIKLSGGQKQRLAIARAVISDPKILVLDEATSSLDVRSEKLIQSAIDQLTRNKTTFIIAHRLSTVKNADKILVLEEGKIAEQGKHYELMEKEGLYHKFYTLQFAED